MHKGSTAVLLFGGLLGAGVALLSAPGAGRETRHRIRDFAEDLKGKAECYAGLAKGKVTSTVWKGKKFFREQQSIITAAVEAGRDAYEREKERFAWAHSCKTGERKA
jgi:gas vesicle protein